MRTIALVIDCLEPERLADFWAAALGYEKAVPLGNYVVLSRGGSWFPKLLLQQVPEPKALKNRMHLDVETSDIEEEATRLEALGARRIEAESRSEDDIHWIVMADPEGNEFCVTDGP